MDSLAKYSNNLGCFSGIDPEVNIPRVQEYVDWKKSRILYPLHEYAREKHWGYWHISYCERRWLMAVWYWILERVMDHTKCIHSANSLNRIEKIRAGLLLGQHRSPGFWIDGSICHDV